MKIGQILLVAIVIAIVATALVTAQEEVGEACENPDISAAEQDQLSETESSEVLCGVLRESGGGRICQSEGSFSKRQTGDPKNEPVTSDSCNPYTILNLATR